jgi:hypothetical protein
MLVDFRKTFAFWKVPRLSPFVLIRATCRWRWVWSIGGIKLIREPEREREWEKKGRMWWEALRVKKRSFCDSNSFTFKDPVRTAQWTLRLCYKTSQNYFVFLVITQREVVWNRRFDIPVGPIFKAQAMQTVPLVPRSQKIAERATSEC